MNEHPIIYSGPMVRAILEGRKTKTRRIIKDQPSGPDIFPPNGYETTDTWFFRDAYYADETHPDIGKYVKCPYGRPGDSLWVRETWQTESGYDWTMPRHIPEGSNIRWLADDSISVNNPGSPFGKVRPSIFIPRWASRINLKILNIRVERLQEITKEDAKAEGVSNIWEWNKERAAEHPEHFSRGVLNPYVANFSVLWDTIHGAGAWDLNPWVWVLEFQKTT